MRTTLPPDAGDHRAGRPRRSAHAAGAPGRTGEGKVPEFTLNSGSANR